MTATLQMLILGVVQGMTEFLPVSTSGHLVLASSGLGLEMPRGPAVEVVFHVGSMLAIMAYYRRRLLGLAGGMLRREQAAWRLVVNVLLAAVPVLVVYPLLGDFIGAQFENHRTAATLLCVTGLLLLSTRFAPAGVRQPSPCTALIMGLGQALALLPGISRSGATLVAARWQRQEEASAAELSFLMVLPLLGGAALLNVLAALRPDARAVLPLSALAVGMVTSTAVGYLALTTVVRVFAGRRFHWFGAYCLAVGIVGLCLVC